MIRQLEAKYTLFDSVEEMLAPETLSIILQTSVPDVRCSPLVEREGTSTNNFEWVTTKIAGGEEQRYALKRIRLENDWLMITSNDVLCRSVTLWQYGILDKLSPRLDHTVIACSRDDNGWAILMKDVSAGMYPVLSEYFTPHRIRVFLDALAFMHAAYWQDDTLAGAHLGLNDSAGLISMTSVPTAQKFSYLPSPVSGWILEGWEIMQTLLQPDAAEICRHLMLNPQLLCDALQQYPATLVHGDFRAGGNSNLSYMAEQPVPACVFDWQFASYAPMTVDLTWFINRAEVRAVITPVAATAYYRKRLEHYLGFHFDSASWQAMLELAFLADALRFGPFEAFFSVHDPDKVHYRHRCAVMNEYNDQIRAGAQCIDNRVHLTATRMKLSEI